MGLAAWPNGLFVTWKCSVDKECAIESQSPRSISPFLFAKDVIRDFRSEWRVLLVFHLLFQAARVWLFAPVMALILASVLLQAGQSTVSNQDLAWFLLTPWGVCYVAVLAILTVTVALVEQTGLMALAMKTTARRGASRDGIWFSWRSVGFSVGQAIRLAITKLGLLALAVTPLVLAALLAYSLLLTGYDIYFYLHVRPREFWIAASLAVIFLAAAAGCGMFLSVRWSLALPILMFESHGTIQSLKCSRERVRGAGWPIAIILAVWLGLTLASGGVVAICVRLLAQVVLAALGEDSWVALLLLLGLQAALLSALSFFSSAGLAITLGRLYSLRSAGLDQTETSTDITLPNESAKSRNWLHMAPWVVGALVLMSPLSIWGYLARKVALRPKVLVTAHRGHSHAAPENTLAAMQKAIEAGADYAEIDVHQTSDGAVVLLHDRDLNRVAGDSRRLSDVSFDEARRLDVGTWFDPRFAGERIPTLEEAIALCRGKIRLNIEIKVFGSSDELAAAVGRIVTDTKMRDRCLVTSLSQEVLVSLRKSHPGIPIGLIIGQSIGNVNRLDLDAISVRAEHLSDAMLRNARERHRHVMVWGMSGENQIRRQLQRGVDNLITGEVELALRLRDDWMAATDRERLVATARLLLGLPAPSLSEVNSSGG